MIRAQRLRREKAALSWLRYFKHDPELVAILGAASNDDRIHDLFWLIAWAQDRGLILHPEHLDRNGDPIAF
jgi:hypothetical protein